MHRILATLAVAAASSLVAPLVVGIALPATPVSAALPSGFSDVTLPDNAANPLASPTDITPLPDGRAFVLEKGGAVRLLLADGSLLASDLLTLAVCTVSEAGLLGAAVDPAFASNGFVYLYWSRNAGNCASATGRFNRLSRFTMTGNTIDPASELVLLDNMAIPAGNHNGGDLHIGGDGDLYVSVGDAGSNPRGSGPSAAQDLSLLNGKILRITLTGGVPADNPFVGASGAMACATAGTSAPTNARCTEIYAYGLRNPYRFAFDPNDGNTTFFVNDVGASTWEEVDRGGKGLNYGWDTREGFCANGSSSNCGSTPAAFTDPLTAYNHSSGCSFVTAGAFVPAGLWPSAYDDSYLFADGGCGQVWQRTAAGKVDYSSPFATTSGTIVDMAFVTQQGTTYLVYVTNSTSRIHRIRYTPPVATTPDFVPVTPSRLADTRSGGPTVDGASSGGGPLAGGTTLEVTVAGRGGVATDAVAAALNVTATGATAGGFVTVFPCGGTRPGTSNLNFAAGATVPNAVIARIGTAGKVCLFTYATVDLVVDVDGYFPTGTTFAPVPAARVLETRPGLVTIDGVGQGGGPRAAGSSTTVVIGGRAGVPAAAGAAVLNVAVTGPTAPGYVTVYPCGSSVPNAANVNFTAGSTSSRLVLAKLGTGGAVCIFTSAPTDLVVDVGGSLPASSTYTGLTPARLLETRSGLATVDGVSNAIGVRGAGSVTTVQVTGRGGVPAGATTAVLSIAVTGPVAAGFITAFPCDIAVPLAATLTYAAGDTVSNAALVRLSPTGTVCLFTYASTDLIVDVQGSFP